MKITKLTTFVVPPRWCFLKIETDEGITGWGEPVLEGRAHTVAAAVEELSDYLIGKDPSPIEDHWTVLYRGGFYRGGGDAHERPRRHRPGVVGHQGQGTRCPGASAARRTACATASASTRGSAATGRRTPPQMARECGGTWLLPR